MEAVSSTERQCRARIGEQWPAYLRRRAERLDTGALSGKLSEKVAETIMADLFSEVLDWPLSCVGYQVDRADMLLCHNGIKRLIVETKAPGGLTGRRAFEQALEQAKGYAAGQYVRAVAIADGVMLYVADLIGGACRDRVLVRLDTETPPVDDLWRLSVHGIYRECPPPKQPLLANLSGDQASDDRCSESQTPEFTKPVGGERRPAECFAFIGDLARPSTWKLPYRLASGAIDHKRLAMAAGAVLRNYRGQSVAIPQAATPEVLFRLGRAAWQEHRFNDQLPGVPAIFTDLKNTLLQLGLWDEVQMDEPPAWDRMDRTPGT